MNAAYFPLSPGLDELRGAILKQLLPKGKPQGDEATALCETSS
jgi:hypothetical protein